MIITWIAVFVITYLVWKFINVREELSTLKSEVKRAVSEAKRMAKNTKRVPKR